MLKEAAKYDMSKLVSLIPDKFKSQGLVDFAKSLDKYADLFRHSSKSAAAPATTSTTASTTATTPPNSSTPKGTAKGAFATLLQNRMASGRVPQNVKAGYGAMLTPQNTTAQTPQPTNPKQATATATGAFATLLKNRLASGRVQQHLKAKYSSMLTPQSGATPASAAVATQTPQQSSQTLHPNAMKMQSSIAKRLQAQLNSAQPGSYTYNKAMAALNALASNGGK